MDSELKAKWIRALRGGKYKQANGVLRNPADESYCCLGVLGKIQGADPAKLSHKVSSTLPDGLNAGLRKPVRVRLANMNDGTAEFYNKRHSFKQIADYIEKKL